MATIWIHLEVWQHLDLNVINQIGSWVNKLLTSSSIVMFDMEYHCHQLIFVSHFLSFCISLDTIWNLVDFVANPHSDCRAGTISNSVPRDVCHMVMAIPRSLLGFSLVCVLAWPPMDPHSKMIDHTPTHSQGTHGPK